MAALFDTGPAEAALASLLAFSYTSLNLIPQSCLVDGTERISHRKALLAHLRDIRATCRAVSTIEHQIATLVYKLKAYDDAAVTALAPVSGLPNELLEEIFLAVVADDRSPRSRMILSHVSSRWRQVSVGLQPLWTVIDLPSVRQSRTFRMFAQRSGELRTELSLVSLGPQGSLLKSLEVGREDVGRLSKLSLRGKMSEKFMSSLDKYAQLLLLDKVELSYLTTGDRRIKFPSWMTAAKSLHISNCLDVFASGRPQSADRLASLQVSNIHTANVDAILGFLGPAQALRELKLWNIQESHSQNIEIRGLDRQLTAVMVEHCGPRVCCSLLFNWHMPNLLSFKMISGGIRDDVYDSRLRRFVSSHFRTS